jgi:leucyl aminopeptidase
MPSPELRLIGAEALTPCLPVVLPVMRGAVPTAFAMVAKIAGFTGKPDETLRLNGHAASGNDARIVLLVGLGRDAKEAAAEAAGACAAATVSDRAHLAIDGRGLPRALAVGLAVGAAQRAWRFPVHRQGAPAEEEPAINRIDLIVDDPDRVGRRWLAARDMNQAQGFARDLVAEPSNSLTPAAFLRRLSLLEEAGIGVEVISGEGLASERLGLLAAVGRGSANPPALAILTWPGALPLAPVALVGKGMTFDTGGISIKPAHGMWDMRGDMAGAAACVGAMLAIARRKSPAPVVAVLALAENMIGADAYRPGDVIRSHHGQTVQIIDTDAEGRLILADAISYAIARFKPRAVIDLATLTGAVVVALGHEMAGLYDNDAVLAANLSAAGLAVQERLWRMPVTEGDREALVSDIADIKQCIDGRMVPDASLGAAFIRAFVTETPWAHLDIGGTELREEADTHHAKGPTGFGVRLLDRLIALRYEDPDHP